MFDRHHGIMVFVFVACYVGTKVQARTFLGMLWVLVLVLCVCFCDGQLMLRGIAGLALTWRRIMNWMH